MSTLLNVLLFLSAFVLIVLVLIKLARDNEITSFIVILYDLILTGKFYCLNFFY